jgi:hypothetical protein
MKIFIEYKVIPGNEAEFKHVINQMKESYPNLEVFQGTDQPGLFVEIWDDVNYQEYEKFKYERLHHAQWDSFNSFIAGGKEKLHMWHFTVI